MNFQWILNPLTLYSALALCLMACLIFFASLKRELHRVRLASGEAGESARGGLGALSQELEQLKQSVKEIETRPASPVPSQSVNLTKRAQALRMLRRGEPVCTIAAALQTPQNEIQLLLKIDELVNFQ